MKRASRALRRLRTQLDHVVRDTGRKIGEDARLREINAGERACSLHAPEVECIGKRKAFLPSSSKSARR